MQLKLLVSTIGFMAAFLAGSALSQPPGYDMAWSPSGKKLAYFKGSSGGANGVLQFGVFDVTRRTPILVFREGRLKSLLGLNKRDPLPTIHFEWSPDNSALLFASPSCLTWFDVRTKKHRALVDTQQPMRDPKFSPDGTWVSFVQGHNLWLVPVVGGQPQALTTSGTENLRMGEPDWLYKQEFGVSSAYWWAPDSSSIAFLETDESPVAKWWSESSASRAKDDTAKVYPRAGSSNPVVRVSVIDLQERRVRRMNTGPQTGGYTPCVTWLPDSRQVAIQHLNRSQTELELLLANAATGTTRVLLTEKDAYWINVHDDLRFLHHSSQFLWSSERTGYRHLYLYSLDGQLETQITRGNWEVTQVNAVDESRKLVYFTSTEKDSIERHVVRIGFDGSGLRQITAEPGWHSALFAADSQTFVDTHSSAEKPPAQDIRQADGNLLASLQHTSPSDSEKLPSSPEFLKIGAHDGTLLNAMFLKPPRFDPAHKYPVLVYIDGGPNTQVVRNSWGGQTLLWHEKMAENGFLVFAVDNRGTAGRGHLFEEPIHCRFGAQELSDQRDGIAYLRKLPYVDKTRIGIWGTGYGGQMVLHAIFEDPQDFKAGWAASPVADWLLYDTAFTERYLEVPQAFSKEFDESSPVSSAGRLRGKLLVTATESDQAQKIDIVALAAALEKAGKQAQIVYSAEDLQVSDESPSSAELFAIATKFFLDTLGQPQVSVLANSTRSKPASAQN